LFQCRTIALPAGAQTPPFEGDQLPLLYVEEGLLVARVVAIAGRRAIIGSEASPGAFLVAPDEGQDLHALRDSRLTVIPHDALDGLVAIVPIARVLVAGLEEATRRARETTQTLAHMRQTDRVRVKLLQLAKEHGRVSPQGIRLEFPLTHQILAAMIGSARETVTRALDQLEREGFLARDGRGYRLLVDPERIAA